MATKPETQMAALLRHQTTSHVFEIPEKKPEKSITQGDKVTTNSDTKNSITKESKNVGNKEVKKKRNKEKQKTRVSITKKVKETNRNQEVKKSTKKETKKSRKTPNKTEMIRHAVNLTMCDDVKEALAILAAKRRVMLWKLLDQAVRQYLKREGENF